jgi:hypothetical protein
MSSEQRKEQYRANYYKNLEANRAKARERSAKKRASYQETPEEAEARRVYNRAHYARNTGPARMEERKLKADREHDELVELVPKTEPQRTIFKMLLIGLLADKYKAKAAYRLKWKKEHYVKKPRPVKVPKQVKDKKPPLTKEERSSRKLAYKRAYEKRRLENAKKDPEKLAELRNKRRSGSKKWIDNLKASDPERHLLMLEKNREKSRAYRKERWKNDPAYRERQNEWFNTRRKEVPEFRLGQYIRNRINQVLKSGFTRTSRAFDLVGCTPLELKAHLESQFVPGMNWSNHGMGEGDWQIDHHRPLASFDLSNPDQQKEAFSWKNLKPEWARVNASKNSHWQGRRWKHADHTCPPTPPP